MEYRFYHLFVFVTEIGMAILFLFYCLAYHIDEKNPQTVNPALNPGHPDQQREESPAERISQPLSTAAPCWGQHSVGRPFELPTSKSGCCNSAKISEDGFITDVAHHHPP